MGIFDKSPSGSFFDFDGDGETSWAEEYLAYNIYEECTRDDDDDDDDYDDFDSGSSDFEYDWRDEYDYDVETGLDPDDYKTEEEYLDAKHEWRNDYLDDYGADISPEDYETENEYLEAKHEWRNDYNYDYETGLDPDDYETEDEFLEAKYSWRDDYVYDFETGIDPDDYETEDEYNEALKEAKHSWQDGIDDTDTDIDPEDYDTKDEYEEAVKEAKYGWRNDYEFDVETGLDPDDYETEDDFLEAKYEWRDNYIGDYGADISPEDYETEDEYLAAKYDWRDNHEYDYDANIDPDDYETEEEFIDDLNEAKYGWRDDYIYDPETDIDPDDYETEEEYIEALEDARQRNHIFPFFVTDVTNSKHKSKTNKNFYYGKVRKKKKKSEKPYIEPEPEPIKKSDYPNKRTYKAAINLSDINYLTDDLLDEYWEDYQLEYERCSFILNNFNSKIAAKYLTPDGEFLYAQAIKDNFQVPIALPDEDEAREIELYDIIKKIDRKDTDLAIKIWHWCINQFLPCSWFAHNSKTNMVDDIINSLYGFSSNFRVALVYHLEKHPKLRTEIIRNAEDISDGWANLVYIAIKENLHQTAKVIFNHELIVNHSNWQISINFINNVISRCRNCEELESMEFFRQELLPYVKKSTNQMVLDEIEEWENEIDEYIELVEKTCNKYAFCRRYAWRNTVPDGSSYGIKPEYYDTKEEYVEAYNSCKRIWQKRYENCETYGLLPTDFETEEEFTKALLIKKEEAISKKNENSESTVADNNNDKLNILEDTTIYTYCGVVFPFSQRVYNYRVGELEINIGDTVIAAVNYNGEREVEGKVVSVGQYSKIALPYPLERTKFIIRKI